MPSPCSGSPHPEGPIKHSAEIVNAAHPCTVRSVPAAVLSHQFVSATLDHWKAEISATAKPEHGIRFPGQPIGPVPVIPTTAADGFMLHKRRSKPVLQPIEFDPAQRTIQGPTAVVEVTTAWTLGNRKAPSTVFAVAFDVVA